VEEWKLEPAHDLGLQGLARYRSLSRESGLVESTCRLASWGMIRGLLRFLHGLRVIGRENLPPGPSFVLAANHASHLDALVLGAAVPLAWRDHIFPIAAGDLFFENAGIAALVTTLLNALPIWRRKNTPHQVKALRQRLVEKPSIYILFPEGTRTRDGQMRPFKSGVGMMVAGTPVPVVPCHLHGTFEAFPPGCSIPRIHRITLRIGTPLTFPDVANNHAGWDEIGRAVETAVHGLAALAHVERLPKSPGLRKSAGCPCPPRKPA
jgi:1-acyl-sn-glycerol-3-phosphate acyltransferase